MCGLLEHAQPPYFYLPWVSVQMSAALKGQTKRGIALYEMADLYASRELIWEGWLPLKKKVEWHCMESGLSRKKL